MLPTVKLISSGRPSCEYESGVPHVEQNVRRTSGDERYETGLAAVH
jgi:hypothetical protein